MIDTPQRRSAWRAARRRQFGALISFAALGFPSIAHAQWQGAPERPAFPASADLNDWSAYYDKGVELLRSDPAASEAAFYWASHIAPDRAESLRLRAMIRNPFLHRGLEIALYDQLGGSWGYDDFSRGLLAYAQPDFRSAVALLGRAIKSDPKGYLWQRLILAQAFVALANYDSAEAEVQTIRAALARAGRLPDAARAYKTATALEPWYPTPWLELGRALVRTNDSAAARGAFATYIARAPRTEQAGIRAAHDALASLSSPGKP